MTVNLDYRCERKKVIPHNSRLLRHPRPVMPRRPRQTPPRQAHAGLSILVLPRFLTHSTWQTLQGQCYIRVHPILCLHYGNTTDNVHIPRELAHVSDLASTTIAGMAWPHQSHEYSIGTVQAWTLMNFFPMQSTSFELRGRRLDSAGTWV